MGMSGLRKSIWTAFVLVLSSLCVEGPVASAQTQADLSTVKPVISCSALAAQSLRQAVGVDVALQASTVDTPKGPFCHVTGLIAPAIHLEVDLPVEHWTQRLLQVGCGGLCGMINASIGNAGGCQPALNGEFVVAATDMGHQAQMGAPGEGDFASDPEKRIDFAYRANHLTALAAKALIRMYYGQVQRFAYFSGCSDGGREAMMEAERFPDDFNGISAGAPAMYFQIQNSLNHSWTQAANTRPDGTKILERSKLEVLHAAVIEHCDTLDGIKDGLLTDPRACKVKSAWVECPAGATDTAKCLTPADVDIAHYPFTVEQFRRATVLHSLNDATDTNLRPFASHDGRLIMYHGWSDTSIAPLMSVAYYTAVQRTLGKETVDHFYRLFMIPGMGHCGGGDGFSQFDTLSPLMAWVEQGKAPAMLVGEKVAPGTGMAGPDGRGGRTQTAPYARPNQPAQASRPIYPFPQIPLPIGKDLSTAKDFRAGPSDVSGPVTQPWVGSDLLAPKTPAAYAVLHGELQQISERR